MTTCDNNTTCHWTWVVRIPVKVSLMFILLFFIPQHTLFSQVDPAFNPVSKLRQIKNTDNDSLQIVKLFDRASFFFDYMGDDHLADSISQVAIQVAEMSHRPELLLLSYNRYIESNNLFTNYKKALSYALKAEQVSISYSPDIAFLNAKNLASVYLSGYEYDKALEYSYRSLSIATINENLTWKAESYMDIGKSLEGKNQKIEAFRNYLNALSIVDRIKNPDLQVKCFSLLSRFYNLNKLYNKATHYKLMQRAVLNKEYPIDSVALIWTMYDLQVIDINSNNNQLNERSMQEILDFAKRKKNHRLLEYEIALIRTHLIEANQIGQLYDLYYKQFPFELAKLTTENPGLYYRLKAFFCEEKRMADSATYNFKKAETILQSDPNKVQQSNFFYRYGQFLKRQGLKDKSIEKFSKSYQLARDASYFDYMLSASKQLESIYVGKGDYKNAYNYAVLNKVISDSMNNVYKNDQMIVMEIDHETRQRDQSAELEKQSTIRRHSLQYTAMIIAITGIFIVLLMLGSLKVPEWIIKTLGFFSFIFFFEFIVLLADHKIQEITHEEPWKILLIKILLIAILFPMHHWIEKRVVTFLLNPGLINISRYPLGTRLREQITRIKRT